MKLIVLTLGAVLLQAQTLDRTKPPRTPPLASYKLPPVSESKLPNGMSLMFVRDMRFPMVTLRLSFDAGSKYDPTAMSGLSETTGTLLKEGTSSRSSRQIAEELASIGGNLNSLTGADTLAVSGNALSENTAKLIELLADIVRNANFPDDEVMLRKQNRKQELEAARAQSDTIADEKFYRLVYGAHPYGRMLPTAESIDHITREAIVGFRDRFLVPNNAVLLAVGNLPPEAELRKMIQQRFGNWAGKPAPKPPAAAFPAPQRQFVLVDRPGSVQADIRVGRLAVNRASPDYFALQVGSGILGSGGSSRMFQKIREEKGWAYDAHSTVATRKDAAVFIAVTQVRNEVLAPAMEELLAEMNRMATEPVQPGELTTIKNFLSGIFVLSVETQGGLAGQLSSVKSDGLPNDYLEKYVTRVRSVEPPQIEAIARRYITPASDAIVVVGDAAKILQALEKFGKVTVEKGAP